MGSDLPVQNRSSIKLQVPRQPGGSSSRTDGGPGVHHQIGVTEQTYYRWRKEYGGLRLNQAKRLKVLEKENARLKKLVADLSLDKQYPKGSFLGKLLGPFEERDAQWCG